MKAGKKNNESNQVQLTGKVVLQPFARGSKSEHEAVCLVTDEATYLLRRMGGNPFFDPQLQKLIGKKIKATGVIDEYLFIISETTIDRS
jgi:hypothetical protein